MSERVIYLFKAARRPLYRKENLALLAAERGSVVDVSYNRTWVAPALQAQDAIPAGARVRLVFTDRPYTHFVPVRAAEVLEASWDELMLRLRVVLGNWIGAESLDPVGFAELLKAADPGGMPGNRFVAAPQEDVMLTPYFGEREDEGWRRAVDGVLAMSGAGEDRAYHGSVFFRPVGLRVDGELYVARRVPLAPGTRAALVIAFHNPHLSESDVAHHTLRVLAAEHAVRVDVPERFPAVGELEVPFEVIGDDPTLTVEIGPTPSEHTSITLRLGSGARGVVRLAHDDAASHASARTYEEAPALSPPVSEAGSDAQALASRKALLRVYDVVMRNARMEPADALDVLDAFDPLLPGEQRLAERRALLLHATGDVEGAWNVLRGLDPEIMGNDARFLLFRLHAERDGGVGLLQRVLTLDLTAEGRFTRFVEALDGLSPNALARLIPSLVGELPAEQLREVVSRAASRLESPDAIAETARNLFLVTGDAEWAYTFLDSRRHELRLADSVIVDALVELAAAGGLPDGATGLLDETGRRIGNLIEQDRLDEAMPLLRQASSALSRPERDRLYHRVADRLERRRDPVTAAGVMVELAYAACTTGDLDAATRAVERAVGLWASTAFHGAATDGAGSGGPARTAVGGSAFARPVVGAAIGSVPAARPGTLTGAEANGAPETGPVAPMPSWLADAVAAVRRAWESVEELVEWRRDDEARLRESLHARYLNRRILIAGGRRDPEWVERLRELTGAEVDWAEHYRDEGDDLAAFAERIRQKHYDIVLYLLQKSGHEVQHRLRPACAEAGVPWVPTTTAGWRGVVEGVGGRYSSRASLRGCTTVTRFAKRLLG